MTTLDGTKKRLKSISAEHLKATPIDRVISRVCKRIFELVAAFLGLLVLSPLFVIIAIAIRRDSPGPVFYWCRRMGKGRRPFRMLKFRTMYEQASSYNGPPVTFEGDDRITPIGHWLRDTKINELPQLWNVLIGDMSLVGPRPEDVEIAEGWPQEALQTILSVRPGITSPASILYHDEEHLLSKAHVMSDYFINIMPDKMRLDLLYVRNQSFAADLDIIFWTFVIIIPRITMTKIPEGFLFAGPISQFVHRYANWFLIDFLTSYVVINFLVILWRLQVPLNWGMNYLLAMAVVLALFFSSVNWLMGVNHIVWSRATFEDGMGLLVSGSLVSFLILVINYIQAYIHLFDIPPLPVILVLSIGMVAQIGFIITRFKWRVLTGLSSRWLNWRRNAAGTGERVLILGSGEGFQTAAWLLRRAEFQYLFTIVGVVDDDIPTQLGMWVNGSRVLGGTADIPRLVEKYDVGVIMFTLPTISPSLKDIIYNICADFDLRIAFLHQIVKMLSQQLTLPASSFDYLASQDDTVNYLALHDLVTGLPNRFLLRDQLIHSLAYARRYKTQTTVMFFQIDGFSRLLDRYGKDVCDDLLRQVAKRILRFKRESDTLAVIEAGEFGLIIENLPDEGVISKVAQRIHQSISESYLIHNTRIVVNTFISICGNLDECERSIGMGYQEIDAFLVQRKMVLVAERAEHGMD